jgi:uncharacterized radical SAM superfamily Fe-S cluster-containing enzyme
VEGKIITEGAEAFLVKACKEHGVWRVPIWRGDPPYEGWARPKGPVQPDVVYHEIDRGCPFDCGLCPAHRQHPCSVLLELTMRCDLACPVCFADAGASADPDPDLHAIGFWYDRIMAAAGPCNIQLSGGEPTLRDDLPDIIVLGREKGFSFIQLNTNGLRLAKEADLARVLRDAGLSTVFLQFDGISDDVYSRLRGRALMAEKRAAIERCAEAGLAVVLVPTLVPGVNTGQIGAIVRFGLDRVTAVKGVHFQPVSYFGRYPSAEGRITLPEVMTALEEQTDGLLRKRHFLPPGTENDHCSFHGSFVVMPGGGLMCLTSSRGVCCSKEDGRRGLERTISSVARQWSTPLQVTPEAQAAFSSIPAASPATWSVLPRSGPVDLDDFLQRAATHSFSISCMAFQDAWTLDIERLRDCCISVVSPDGRLIPFCAYNLTSVMGQRLYRGRDKGRP